MSPAADLSYQEKIAWLNQPDNRETLKQIRRGIEKESLRVDASGNLSQKTHPTKLGSALTHPQITTDYSEALLELITGTHASIHDVLMELDHIHRVVFHHLGDEYLWTQSMPCRLGDNTDIPIAQYGQSNLGKMKHLYRKGLGARYGRKMQTIAGIHYNFSLPDAFWSRYAHMPDKANKKHTHEQGAAGLQPFISEHYFALIRNAHRLGWLNFFLLGSSPIIDQSFQNLDHPQLKPLGKHSRYAPMGTSLRMSDLGYQNSAQSELNVCYNTLETYLHTLNRAIDTPSAQYESLGKFDAHGIQQQINTHLLQIENEYYGSIRPKRVTHKGERPTLALARRGVEYVELRSIDLDPFTPIGITRETCCFIEIFLLYALLSSSPPLNQTDLADIQHNLNQTVFCGRNHATLKHQGKAIKLSAWAGTLLTEMEPIAECLTQTLEEPAYVNALKQQQQKLIHVEQLPAERVIQSVMGEQHQEFTELGMQIAKKNKAYFGNRPLTDQQIQTAEEAAAASHQARLTLEQSTQIPFETYLENYFAGVTPE